MQNDDDQLKISSFFQKNEVETLKIPGKFVKLSLGKIHENEDDIRFNAMQFG